ncbi:MAG: hypothetical protein HQK56_12385 [Deltaproteobacteria bacterium]|nr:hypothetical protein [Deltaproteobacteria bacterium]
MGLFDGSVTIALAVFGLNRDVALGCPIVIHGLQYISTTERGAFFHLNQFQRRKLDE